MTAAPLVAASTPSEEGTRPAVESPLDEVFMAAAEGLGTSRGLVPMMPTPDEEAERLAADHALAELTIRTLQPRCGSPLSREDARQMVANLSGFFGLLQHWQQAAESEAGGPSQSLRRDDFPAAKA